MHFKRNCPQLKNGKSKSESSSNNTTVVVHESSDEGDDGDVQTVSRSSYVNAWVLDSGTFYHMMYNRDWFDSFKE